MLVNSVDAVVSPPLLLYLMSASVPSGKLLLRESPQTARTGVPLSLRWQEMLNVYLSTLINNIVPLGFTADQNGLVAYNHHFTGLMASSSPQTDELKAMHKNVSTVAVATEPAILTPPVSSLKFAASGLQNRSGRRCCRSRLASISRTGLI